MKYNVLHVNVGIRRGIRLCALPLSGIVTTAGGRYEHPKAAQEEE